MRDLPHQIANKPVNKATSRRMQRAVRRMEKKGNGLLSTLRRSSFEKMAATESPMVTSSTERNAMKLNV